MIIKKEEVGLIDLGTLVKYLPHNVDEFLIPNGEPYKFYAYISTLFSGKVILDVGTRMGLSALAFAYNDSNNVISYDLVEQGASNIKKDNLEFKIIDFRNDNALDYSKIGIISIDVDPHDGIKEREMVSFLMEKGWNGLLILDDVLTNWVSPVPGANPQEMNNFWNEIKEEKYELSEVGHYSGTGIVNFGNKLKIEIK